MRSLRMLTFVFTVVSKANFNVLFVKIKETLYFPTDHR